MLIGDLRKTLMLNKHSLKLELYKVKSLKCAEILVMIDWKMRENLLLIFPTRLVNIWRKEMVLKRMLSLPTMIVFLDLRNMSKLLSHLLDFTKTREIMNNVLSIVKDY